MLSIFSTSAGGENRGIFNKDNLEQFTLDLGLDAASFNEYLDTGKYAQIAQSETNAGRQLGIQSTPTFLLNGQPIVGAQPFKVFEQVIKDQLIAAAP